MIALSRHVLPSEAQRYLDDRSTDLAGVAPAGVSALAESLWQSKSRARFREIRNALLSMCSGIERCMYCEDSAATDIDHHEPRAVAPLRTFEWGNYLAACSACNSNYKRGEFPRGAAGERLLLDPTADDPADHLTLSPTTGRYAGVPGSTLAAESIRVFGLNRETLAAGRRNAWVLLEACVIAYALSVRERALNDAQQIASAVQLQPFAGVLRTFLVAARTPESGLVTAAACEAVAVHPEIATWSPGAVH